MEELEFNEEDYDDFDEIDEEESDEKDDEVTEELQLQIFGSPGGKTRVSEKLVKYIPDHKTYVEPFAGGAAVYFKKKPCNVEVLNDKNSEIAFAYAFIKGATDAQMAKLKTLNWRPTKARFFQLRDSEIPKDPIQRFYRFYYVLIYSYGLSAKTYGYFEKNKFHIEKRLAKLKERLKNTKIYNENYLEVMKSYDSSDTLFFLDPPYPNEWTGSEGTKLFSKEDTQKLHDYLKTIKGKFLMTINSLDWIVNMFKDFNEYKLLVPRTFKHGDKPKYELIVTNYNVNEVHKKNEEKLQLDQKEVYNNWKELVNMTEKELKEFYKSDEGKSAGLTKEEAEKAGVKSGRTSAKWIMMMLHIADNYAEAEKKWTPKMWEWAKRQNSFISRMKGVEGPLYDTDGNKTRKHLALLIWGHNPEKGKNAETVSGNVSGPAISGSGLQPAKIMLPEKKKVEKRILNDNFELIKDIENYEPSNIENKVLADDWRIVTAWYSTYIKTDGKGIKYSKEDIVNLAKLIYEEINKRVKEDKMKHEWMPEEMTVNARELYNIVSKNNIINKEITESTEKLKPVVSQFKDAIIIKDFISLVGSQIKRQEEHKPNDYDIHVRMDKDKIADYLERAIKVRLYKMVDEKLAEKMHVFFGDASGGHDSFLPMYDLVLVSTNGKVIDMANEENKGEVKIMQPYEPQKPAGSAFFEIDKVIDKLLKWHAN